MNLEQARFNMIEQQIRPWEVLSPDVLRVIDETPRHHFVSESQQQLAYIDLALPIGEGQRMMEPRVEGRLLQSLKLEGNETVLEIGTGSGYLTALLSKLAQNVHSIELYPSLATTAAERLHQSGIDNCRLMSGDALASDWNPGASFDVVVLTGSVNEVPPHLLQQVRESGRLFALITQSGIHRAVMMYRNGPSHWSQEWLFETDTAALIAPQRNTFTF